MLLLFAIIRPGMSADEMIGTLSLHAVPGCIGAILGRRQLEVEQTKEEQKRRQGDGAKIFFMGVGAIFLAFQLAPTEEMVLIGHKMTGWHGAGLAIVSLLTIHAFTCSVELRQQATVQMGDPGWNLFLRFTIVGYATALLISLYVLWTFGRLDGLATAEAVMATLVLIPRRDYSAGAARLIL